MTILKLPRKVIENNGHRSEQILLWELLIFPKSCKVLVDSLGVSQSCNVWGACSFIYHVHLYPSTLSIELGNFKWSNMDIWI